MEYYSTNNKYSNVTFKEALFTGMPNDNGLYMPSEIPNLYNLFTQNSSMSFQEIAFIIASEFIQDELSVADIHDIIFKAITFPAPNNQLSNNIFCLELFHGPTFAFKDFGAQFMARCLEKFINKQDQELNILVATSGDTGSAVANGFYNVEGINVIILYPSGKVSYIQEKQLTTLGGNIYALEVNGTFDDCQKLVKQAFLDKNLKNKINISSANSINIARLIPQTFYYGHSYMQIQQKEKDLVYCVPSGNFGNITAGVIAKQMGVPIKKFIAATNLNDVVPQFFETSIYNPKVSIKTMSNAMDVGNPSNIDRLMDIYSNLNNLKADVFSWSFTDEQTSNCILKFKKKYLLDPHSAVGLLGLLKYLDNVDSSVNGVFLGTAHVAKFSDIIEPLIGSKIKIPKLLSNTIKKKKKSILINNSYKEFYDFLIESYQ